MIVRCAVAQRSEGSSPDSTPFRCPRTQYPRCRARRDTEVAEDPCALSDTATDCRVLTVRLSALTGTYLSVAALKGQTSPPTTLFRLSRGSIAFRRRRGRLFHQMNMQ